MSSTSLPCSEMVYEALIYALRYHSTDQRKSGELFVEHPIRIMHRLQQLGFPEEVLAAALLHDVVEDTDDMNSNIREKFGDRVGFLVYSLTKMPAPPADDDLRVAYDSRERTPFGYDTYEEFVEIRTHMYWGRISFSAVADPAVAVLKMADQIDNMQTLEALKPEKQKAFVKELKLYFLPMFTRLGAQYPLRDTEEYQILFAQWKDLMETWCNDLNLQIEPKFKIPV